MKRRFFTLLLLTTLISFGANAQKGKSFADRITVMGYGEFGYSAKFEDNVGNSNSFNINKIEVLAIGKINHRWDMGITVQFHGKPMLKDLYTQYSLMPELRVRLGQFKTPFTIENNIAPFLNPLINGGSIATTYFAGIAGNPYYYGTAGRDIGLELSGDLLDNLFSYKAVILNGMGMNSIASINPKFFGGGLYIRPLRELTLHTSYLGGHVQPMNGMETHDRHRVSAGFQVKTQPISINGEYMWGKDGEQKGQGAYLTAAIHLPLRYDVIVAGDYLDTNMDNKDSDVFTTSVGLTRWFYGSCRWQIEYQYRHPRNGASFLDIYNKGHKVAAQVQFVF